MAKKIKTYVAGGTTYDVPEAEVDAFLSDFPEAEERVSFVAGKDTFDIPVDEVDDFLAEKPKAKPTFKKKGFLSQAKEAIGTGVDYIKTAAESRQRSKGASPSLKDMTTGEMPSFQSPPQDVPTAADSPPPPKPLSAIDKSIINGTPQDNPEIKQATELNPWLVGPVNLLVGTVNGTATQVLPALDGAQSLFYKGIGNLMISTGNPDFIAKGTKLIADQDNTWFKKAAEATEDFAGNRLPAPYEGDVFSRLLYDLGELAPFLATLAITPEVTVSGMSTKLFTNFFAMNSLGTYSATGDIGEAAKAGVISLGDAAAISMLGFVGSKAGGAITNALSGRIGQSAAGVIGGATTAATMGTGGVAHNVATQIANGTKPENIDWDQAERSGVMWVAFGVPGVVSAAMSTYTKAPKEAIAGARNIEVDAAKLREKAVELEQSAMKEADPTKKAEGMVAASQMHKMADIKAIDEFVGRNPEESIKKIKESDLMDGDKWRLIAKVEEAVLHERLKQQQAELEAEQPAEGYGLPPKGAEPSPFKESVVQEPLYHGTKETFEGFEANKQGPSKGFFFSDKIEHAEKFSKGGEVKEVYLDMKNPLEVEWESKGLKGETKAELVQRAKEAGHDGLIITTTDLGIPIKEHVVFDAKQIKEKAQTKPTEDVKPPSDTNIPPKGESPSQVLKTPSTETEKRIVKRQEAEQERMDMLDRLEKEGESADLGEAYTTLKAKTEAMRETAQPQELQEALRFIEKVEKDKETKPLLEAKIKQPISELRDESRGRMESSKEKMGEVEKPSVESGKTETKNKEKLDIEVTQRDEDGGEAFRVIAKNEAGEKVGMVDVGKEGDVFYVKQAETAKDKRRQGVMTAVYDYVEKGLGKPLEQTKFSLQTKEGTSFLEATKQTKQETDAISKQSTEKVDVGEQPKVSKEDGKGDNKATETKPTTQEGEIKDSSSKGKTLAVKVEGGKKDGTLASTIEDSFSLSEKPENVKKSKIEAPPKPKKGEAPKEKTELEKLSDRVEARRIAQQAITPNLRRRIARMFQEHVVDVNEPFKKALMKEGGEAAQKFINRMNLEAGASARANYMFEKGRERVFGKGRKVMSKNKQEFLGEINDLIRTEELDNLTKKRVDKKVAEMVKAEQNNIGRELTSKELSNLHENVRIEIENSNPMLMHEGSIGGKEATELLRQFKEKSPEFMKMAKEKYGITDYDPKAIEKSISEYHKVLQEQLTNLYENGVIGEAAYKKLREEQPYYSPRKYIEHMDRMDPNGSMSGIKRLEGGSEGEKVVDMNQLMGDVISRTQSLVARNKTLQQGAVYATELNSSLVQNAPPTKAFEAKIEAKKEGDLFIETQFEETPRDKVAVDYFKDGQKQRLWIDKELYEYFDYAKPDQATTMTEYAISMALGTPILKFFATGANPEFAIKNLALDALHVWMTTPEYSPFMPLGMRQLMSDYASVAKDAWTKTGSWKDYIREGGGMDYLTTQGTATPFKFKKYSKTSSTIGQMRDGAAKIGEFSEAWTRLAVRKRYIDNRLAQAKNEGRVLTNKEMKSLSEDGTAFARNYLDFSQGGKTAKYLDKFIPYFNAGIQVTRGSLRAAGKNPKLFAGKLAQLGSLATLLTAWNMGDSGDKEKAEKRRHTYLNDISPTVKARNFILMTNMSYTDKTGNERMLYFKIPKDAMQSTFTSLMEDIYIKAAHDGEYKLMNDKMLASLNNEFRNVTDLGNLPPLIRAAQGYKNNYDSFYESEIWVGREQPDKDKSEEYYNGVTPPRYIKFGDITKMSPVRTNYFAKQFFTDGNLYASILGEFFDGVSVGFEGEAKAAMETEGVEKLKNIPGLRRVLKSTYPKPPDELEEEQRILNQKKTKNDHAFTEKFGKKSIGEIEDRELIDFIEEVYSRDGQYESERIMNKVETMMGEDGVTSAIKKLKWFSPEVRAVGFYKLLKENPDNEGDLWMQAEQAGISSEQFKQEVGRLMIMEDD